MSILGLIPARGGSKGIPGKNVRPLAGKPLIGWTIEAAFSTRKLDAVVVSTDDEEIAAVAREWGADVPFMRPRELATDDAPAIATVLHALEALPCHDAVVLLQPTSPMRGAGHIDQLIAVAETSGAPAVVSVTEPKSHPAWSFTMTESGALSPMLNADLPARRQDLPKVYALNGAMYFARRQWLQRTRSFTAPGVLGFRMDRVSSIDIDDPIDWALAEAAMARRP